MRAAIVGSVRKGGTRHLVGNLRQDVALPLQPVVTRQHRLQGSCASSGEYPECLELLAAAGRTSIDFLSASWPARGRAGLVQASLRSGAGPDEGVLQPNG